ncbi:hypothetical protein ACJRO7_017986 [Eucalyptus globulus]|uniref:Uncharacterized protein n=1 Tax=Eucalyptus globulus TaxID=34317 RepID=A0ABD3KTS6_EUCGL
MVIHRQFLRLKRRHWHGQQKIIKGYVQCIYPVNSVVIEKSLRQIAIALELPTKVTGIAVHSLPDGRDIPAPPGDPSRQLFHLQAEAGHHQAALFF